MTITKTEEFKQTEIGKIPADWGVGRMKDFFTVNYGKSRPKTTGNAPLVGSSGVFGHVGESLINFQTIIIGRKGTAGKAWLTKTPSYPSDTTFYLSPHSDNGELRLDFLYYHLNFQSFTSSNDVIPSLQKHEVEDYAFSCPDITEQEKIAFVLSKIQKAVETQEKIIANLKELKAATMARLFREGTRGEPLKQTEIGEIPQSWNVTQFENFVTLQRGFDLPVNSRVSGNVPVIGSNGIVGYHNDAGCKGPGVMTGRSGSIGLSFYIEGDYWPLNTSLFVVDFHDNHPRFVHYFFQKFNFKKYATGVSVPTLNRNLVHTTMVAIPKKEHQMQIAGVLLNIDKSIEASSLKLEKIKQLFASTLHQLMTGQVRVK